MISDLKPLPVDSTPFEVVLIIFEHAIESECGFALKLLVLSNDMQRAVAPLVFRRVLLRSQAKLMRFFDSHSFSIYSKYIQQLCVATYADPIDLTRLCPALNSLSVWTYKGRNQFYWPSRPLPSLRKICFESDSINTDPASSQFSFQYLPNLTHMQLWADYFNWASLQYLPSLTHFCVVYPSGMRLSQYSLEEEIGKLPDSLQVCMLGFQGWMDFSQFSEDWLAAHDHRVVLGGFAKDGSVLKDVYGGCILPRRMGSRDTFLQDWWYGEELDDMWVGAQAIVESQRARKE